VTIAAAEAGRGFVRALSYQVAPQLRAGTLEIVLADYEELPLPIRIAGRRASAACARSWISRSSASARRWR
jgi:DNA-binding transcriptional LysR family regulator